MQTGQDPKTADGEGYIVWVQITRMSFGQLSYLRPEEEIEIETPSETTVGKCCYFGISCASIMVVEGIH